MLLVRSVQTKCLLTGSLPYIQYSWLLMCIELIANQIKFCSCLRSAHIMHSLAVLNVLIFIFEYYRIHKHAKQLAHTFNQNNNAQRHGKLPNALSWQVDVSIEFIWTVFLCKNCVSSHIDTIKYKWHFLESFFYSSICKCYKRIGNTNWQNGLIETVRFWNR